MAHNGPWAREEGCWWEASLPLTWAGSEHLPRVKWIGLGMPLSKNSCQWAVHIREIDLCWILCMSEFPSCFIYSSTISGHISTCCWHRESRQRIILDIFICNSRYFFLHTITALTYVSSFKSNTLCCETKCLLTITFYFTVERHTGTCFLTIQEVVHCLNLALSNCPIQSRLWHLQLTW